MRISTYLAMVGFATFGEFSRRGIGHHVIERSLSPLEGHGGTFFLSLPFYMFVVMIEFAP